MVMEIRSAKKEDIGNILKVIGSDRFGNKWDKPLAKREARKKCGVRLAILQKNLNK